MTRAAKIWPDLPLQRATIDRMELAARGQDCPLATRLAARTVAVAVDGMRRLGLDTAVLLARAGLEDPGALPAEQRIPYSRVAALWTAAVAATGDVALGLRVAEEVDSEAFAVFRSFARTAAGVRQGIDDLNRFSSLLGDGVAFRLVETEGQLVLVHELEGVRPHPASVDYVLASVVVWIRREISVDFRPARVRLARPQPGCKARYTDFFASPVAFDATLNAVDLGAAAPLAPHRPDALIHGLLCELARDRVARELEDGSLEQRVRAAIAHILPDGVPTARQLAKSLGMSERTLRRRLAKRCLRPSALVDDVRRELAEAYLVQMPVADAAVRLGFSEPSAFYRAYRRWTGGTPRRHLP